jgi:hypothetical protein
MRAAPRVSLLLVAAGLARGGAAPHIGANVFDMFVVECH